jgi:ferredoxin/flavodoxin
MPNSSKKTALILYFSCSQHTARLAKEIEDTVNKAGWEARCKPLRQAAQALREKKADLIVLGTPTQYFTVPESAMQLIRNLPEVSGTPAFVFSTYGGCVTNNVPYILATELSAKGARILGGAQFLTPHSCRISDGVTLGNSEPAFGKGHPDDTDLEQLRSAITGLIAQIDSGAEKTIPLIKLKINNMGIISTIMNATTPLTMKRMFLPHVQIAKKNCTGCRQCVTVCDSGSITYDNAGTVVINRDTCTKCYACIEQCHDEALTTRWKQAELVVRIMNKIARDAAPATICQAGTL